MHKNILMLGDTYRNANLLYKSRFLSSNPLVYLSFEDKSIIVTTSADYKRAVKEATVSFVYPFDKFDYVSKIKRFGHKDLAFLLMLQDVLSYFKIDSVTVPKDFPFFFGNGLIKLGIDIVVDCNLFIKERSLKSADEIGFIEKSQRALEKAMAFAENIILDSKISTNKSLIYNGQAITTNYLKMAIENALIKEDCAAFNTIVACGENGADPHFFGDDYLVAQKPIMIDIFPYNKYTRYFADMSRTFVKGSPSNMVCSMYESVLEAQNTAIGYVKEGVSVKYLYDTVCDVFNKDGYKTLREQNPKEPLLNKGFIHSLGHGVGLDLHETPFIFTQDIKLEAGNVITIEPGLYDPLLGGIRLEDIVLVTKGGHKLLSSYHKELVVS